MSEHAFGLPFEPTSDQVRAIEAILEWWNEGDLQVFRLFGYAGTGKTSIAIYLPAILKAERYRFGAFSGKAVNVLQTKMTVAGKQWAARVAGNSLPRDDAQTYVAAAEALAGAVPASGEHCATLHKLLYGPPIDLKKENARLEEHIEVLQAALRRIPVAVTDAAAVPSFWGWVIDEYKARGRRNFDVGFGGSDFTPLEAREQIDTFVGLIRANERLAKMRGWLYFAPAEMSPLSEVDLLIADEVSMVSDSMAQDILATGVRVVVLGDPEQLPPVRGNGYFVNYAPDAMLRQVTRQGQESPVLAMATMIRAGVDTAQWMQRWADVDHAGFAGNDAVVLCWRRATRWGAVRYIRERLLGRPAGMPVAGDKIMVLANNTDIGVFNGQVFVVDDVEEPLADPNPPHPAHSVPHEWTTGVPIGATIDPFASPIDTFDANDPDVIRMQVHEDGVPDSSTPLEVYRFGFLGEQEERDAERQRLGSRGKVALATFAQASTVHKAQGSEWSRVLFIDEGGAMFAMEARQRGYEAAETQARRFRYTAVTRARDEIVVVRKS